MSRTHRDSRSTIPLQRGSAPWLALLTSTTLGKNSDLVRAWIQGTPEFNPSTEFIRLVVQVYPRRAVDEGKILGWAHPSASTQRAITPEELKTGVPVSLFGFRSSSVDAHDPSVVVAWIEPGLPNLDLDGFDARPGEHPYACAALRSGQRSVRLRLGTRITT